MMKILLAAAFVAVMLLGFASALPSTLNVNVQVENAGVIAPGTYLYNFSISKNTDCSAPDYSYQQSVTTDARGIFALSLPSVNTDFSSANYRLCVYRDGVLKSNSSFSLSPYADTCRISQNATYAVNATSSANATNAIYWQGHTGTDGSWLTGTGNSSWNQSTADNLYADKQWGYNMTTPFENWLAGFAYNYNQTTPFANWLSGFQFNYNQTTPFSNWLSGFVYNYNQTAPAIAASNAYADAIVSANNASWTRTDNATYDATSKEWNGNKTSLAKVSPNITCVGALQNITWLANNTFTGKCVAMSSGGNPFNQNLNTTDNVTFHDVTYHNPTDSVNVYSGLEDYSNTYLMSININNANVKDDENLDAVRYFIHADEPGNSRGGYEIWSGENILHLIEFHSDGTTWIGDDDNLIGGVEFKTLQDSGAWINDGGANSGKGTHVQSGNVYGNYGVCYLDDSMGTLGHCTSGVDSSGGCTCVAN